MSNTIDNRVVSMEFDNAKFERNVATSMNTLDKLKEKLRFKGATKGLEEVEAVSGRVTFAPLGEAVDFVGKKFSMLEQIAIGSLRKIGDRAVNAGEKLIKSLTTDQLSEGWSKFNSKTESVQLIMNATGDSIEEVSSQLDKLNWFTDETSYNFTDMVASVGKFTNNKIPLNEAVDAMQGIATWAGLSGANVQEASRAMYNMSQAIGVGSVKLMDWKSIENANMATAEFKETALETAVELGTLRKAADGVYKTIGKGTEVTVTNFNEALSEGWFSKDVLMKTLNRYGSFATKMKETVEKLHADSASIVLGYMDDFREGTLNIKEVADEAGVSAEELTDILKDLTSQEMDLGERAFRASQEAKTFAEAINATKDAVSTGWMTSFEHIFGNYEEAKELWSDLAERLWDVFASGAQERNKMLALWHKDPGGRPALVEGFWNAFDGLQHILETVKKAFGEVFSPLTADTLIKFTTKLRDLTEKFKMSDETTEKFKNTLKGFFSILHIGKELVSGLFVFVKPLIDLVKRLGSGMLKSGNGFGSWISNLDKVITETKLFRNTFEAVVSFIEKAIDKIKSAFKNFTGLNLSDEFAKLGDKITGVTQKFGNAVAALKAPKKGIKAALEVIEKGADQAHGAVFDLASVVEDSKVTLEDWKKIEDAGEATAELKQEMMDAAVAAGTLKKEEDGVYKTLEGNEVTLEEFNSTLKDNWATTEVLTKATEKLGTANETAAKKSTGFRKLLDGFKAVGEKLSPIFKSLGEIAGKVFGALGDRLKGFADSLDASGISKLTSAGIFATIGISLKKFIDTLTNSKKAAADGTGTMKGVFKSVADFFSGTLKNLNGFFTNINNVVKNFDKVFDSLSGTLNEFKNKIRTQELVYIAVAIGILTLSIVKLSKVEPDKLVAGLSALAIGMGELMGSFAVFSKIAGQGTKGLGKLVASMILFGVAVLILSSALKKLSAIEPEKLLTGVIGLTAIAGILVGVSRLLSRNTTGMIKGAFSLILFAVAIKALAKPVKELGQMDPEVLTKGLMGVLGLCSELVIALKAMEKIDGNVKSAFSILILALAIKMIAKPLKSIAEMPWVEIAKGLVAIGGALAAMAGITILLAKFAGGKALVGALSMLLMAVTLRMIVKPLKALGEMPWPAIGKAMVTMAGALLILAAIPAILSMVSPTSIIGVISLLLMVAVLKGIVEPLKTLSKIPWDGMWRSIIAMSLALTAMALIPALLATFAPTAIIGVVTLLLMVKVLEGIVAPLKSLAELDWGGMWRSVIAISLTLAAMALIPALLATFSPMSIIGVFTLLLMTKVLEGIVAPLKSLAKLDWGGMWRAIIAMTLAFTAMALIPALLATFAPASILGALTLLLMAEALNKAAAPIVILGTMSWGEIARSLTAMAGAFAVMGTVAAGVGVLSPLSVLGAASLGKTADALRKAAIPLKMLATMSWSEIGRGLTAMSAVMAVLSAAMFGFNPFAKLKAEGFSAMATSLKTIVDPLKSLGKIDYDSLKHSLEAMHIIFDALAEVTGGTKFADLFSGARASSFDSLANSIKALAPGLAILSRLDQEAVKTVLGSISQAFSDFGTALKDSPWFMAKSRASGIGALAENISTLSANLPDFMALDSAKVKTALSTLGEGFKSFGEALDATPWWSSKSRAEGIGALLDNIEPLTTVLPGFMELDTNEVSGSMETLGEGFKKLGESLKASPFWGAGSRADALTTVVASISELANGLKKFFALKKSSEDISSAATAISGFITNVSAAVKAFPSSSDKSSNLSKILESLGTELPKLIPALQSIQKLDTNVLFTKLRLSAQAVNEFAEKLTDLEISFDNFEENAVAAGQAFVDAFTKTVNDGKAQVRVAGSNVALAASYGARGQYDAFVKAGKYLMSGLEIGIKNGSPKVSSTTATVVRNARFAAEDEGQIKSPSRVFARIGQFLDLGLVAGLEEYSYKVSTASASVAQSAIDAANEPFGKYGDIFGDDWNATMTITPVLDLSEIQNDRTRLANSLNGFGIGASVSLAEQTAANMARRQNNTSKTDDGLKELTGLVRDLVDNPPSVNHNEFNITSDDPEEVADAVERRLTRNIERRNAVWGR